MPALGTLLLLIASSSDDPAKSRVGRYVRMIQIRMALIMRVTAAAADSSGAGAGCSWLLASSGPREG